MKILEINYYDDSVAEAFEITIMDNDSKTYKFDCRPTDKGYTIYTVKGNTCIFSHHTYNQEKA